MSGSASPQSRPRLSPREIDQQIEEIKRRTTLADVVSSHGVKLKREGRNHVGLSPFTNERTPSFKVMGDRFHCFSSGQSGDIIDWLMATQNMTWWNAFCEAKRIAGLSDGPLTARQIQENDKRRTEARQSDQDYRVRMMKYARSIWTEARSPQGTLVERYLDHGRAIDLSYIGGIPKAIRFHPRVKNRSGEYFPAMVCEITAANNAFAGVHLTFLRPDGFDKIDTQKGDKRATKMMIGSVFGGAIRLITPKNHYHKPTYLYRPETLSLGEGVESTLKGYQLYKEGGGADGLWWAALSLGNLTGAQKRGSDGKLAFAAQPIRRRALSKFKDKFIEFGHGGSHSRIPIADPDRPGMTVPLGWSGSVRLLAEDDLKDDPKNNLSGAERAQRAYALAAAKFKLLGADSTSIAWPPKGQDFADCPSRRSPRAELDRLILSKNFGAAHQLRESLYATF